MLTSPRSKRSPRCSAHPAAIGIALGLALAATAGCGSPDDDPADLEGRQASIIGGIFEPVGTTHSLGLLRLGNDCSASLIHPTWAVTAAHCLNFGSPGVNIFGLIRSDGSKTDFRSANLLVRVGNTDIALAQLAVPNVAQEWPTFTRSPLRSPTPAELTGKNVTCYGRGANAYASPSGFTTDDTWRSLTKLVGPFDGARFTVAAVNGKQIPAPGDSGGPCLYNGLLAATISDFADYRCVDPSSPASCKATTTIINSVYLAAIGPYADYIGFAPSRTNANFFPLTLAAGWSAPAVGGNLPGYALLDDTVHLRGTISTTGTATLAFTLPVNARPAATVDVPITLCNATKGRLEIKTDGTANVWAETDWANAKCLTSLDGVQFNTGVASATALSPLNGWASAPPPFRQPAYRVVSGVVRLQGAVTQGTDPGLPAFVLPAAARPTATVYATVDLCGAKKGRIAINSSGQAFISAASGVPSDAACFTSLEGVTYLVTPVGTVTLLNGWKAYPFSRAPGVTNVKGVIRFQGGITGGTAPTAFLISAEMRPATNVFVPVDLTNGARGRLKIQPDGYGVILPQNSFGDSTSFTSLEGAAFGI